MLTSRTIRSLLRRSPVWLVAFLSLSRLSTSQISLTAAVDLALRSSPRVQMAQADVDKAQAVLSETRDVYIPNLVGGSGLGYSYGFPVGQPSIFNFTAESLVFNAQQRSYLRGAREGLVAANYALMDVRASVAEDTVLTYIALDRDRRRAAALKEQSGFAGKLVRIVQDRLDAGEDTTINLTTVRLTGAQIRLSALRTDDDTALDRAHLASLTGLPGDTLETVPGSIPLIPRADPDALSPGAAPSSPGIEAAFANARAKRAVAFGDSHYILRPQVIFAAQYNRFAKYNNYDLYYRNFQHNNAGIGVQINLPLFDEGKRAKGRESAADAVHAERDAVIQQRQYIEGRQRAQRSTLELAARTEIAELDQELAQQQLDAMLVQVQNAGPSGPPLTPKDEQNSRIAEREKVLSVIDARFQMRQAEINLLRQTGGLETWLKSIAQQQQHSPATELTVAPVPRP